MKTKFLDRIVLLICILRHITGQETQSNVKTTNDSLECSDDQFKCTNGEKCIDELQECDIVADCSDSSDEHELCETFVCDSGDEIPERFHCDGFYDCSDSSDEADCDEFECTNGKTVTQKQVCDQIDDCGDKYRSDECNCTNTFTCVNGKCISNDLACDDVNDCGDNSDEDNCPTAKFTCFNRQVIEANLKCDGKADCDDTSDECVCMGTFTCNNQRCISGYLINDGKDDCGDGSDEKIALQTAAPRQEITNQQQKEEVTKMDITDESSGFGIESTNSVVTSAVPNPNVTLTMTSSRTSMFFCANEMIIDSQLLCDGTDDCEDGYRSDECNCDDTFECAGGIGRNRCIVSDLRCDGYNDCYDKLHSDECGCDDTFTCSITKECLPKSKLCDGKKDCADGSDENPQISRCQEKSECDGGFLCGNGKCINKTMNCDDKDDCGDCSDESECMRPGNLFHCKNGRCIEQRKHCDGKDDCPNADDEDDCDINEKINAESTTSSTKFIKNTTPLEAEEHIVTKPRVGGNGGTPLQASPLTSFLAMFYIFFYN